MKIKAEILNELFAMLDMQKSFCRRGDTEQLAYYNGMEIMLELVLTDYYRIPGAVCADTCPEYPGGPRHTFVPRAQLVQKEANAE